MVGGGKSRKRNLPYKEQDLLNVVLEYLELDSRVAWAKRMNVGVAVRQYQDRFGRTRRQFVRFGFKGLSDIIGQAADGRWIAFETKRSGEKPTDEQMAFIETVNGFGGIAAVVYSLDDVLMHLERANIRTNTRRSPAFELT